MNLSTEMIVALGTAFAAVVTAIGTLISSIRNGKKIEQNTAKVAEVHVLVNSRMTDALQQIATLSLKVANLTGDKADIDVARKANTNLNKP